MSEFVRSKLIETEIITFEVPAKEAATWQPANENQWHDDDAQRLQALLDRIQSGTASMVAHMVTRVPQGYRANASITEEYMTATEFDPPELPNSHRMRPTALATLPVGSRWQVETTAPTPEQPQITLTHQFVQSTAKPVEPSLRETLAIAASETEKYPGAVHHTETWSGVVKVTPGRPFCLGTRKPQD